MATEQWLAVPGYPNHEASNLGRVRSIDHLNTRGHRIPGRMLRLWKNSNGCLRVRVQFEGKSRVVRVHHLVLEAFVGPRPDGMFGCHWNDDPYDNRLENLRWATPSANSLDSVRNRTHAAATRTACPQGHAYTPSNTYVYTNRDGRQTRSCRECKTTSSREWARRRNQAKKAA